jgi:transcriptional regulator with XRE-family HTH domain
MRVRLKQDRLVGLVARSSLSQNHWALKLGLSRGHWSEIVNGKYLYPSPRTRDRMLRGFQVDFDDLFVIEVQQAAPVSDALTLLRRGPAAHLSPLH